MGEVIYGVVFGKPKTEVAVLGGCLDLHIPAPHAIDRFSDDVFYMRPPIEWPSDTEPPNESA